MESILTADADRELLNRMAWMLIVGRLLPGSQRVSFALGRDIAEGLDKLGEDGLTA